MIASLKEKDTYKRYIASLKFSLYCVTHPLDGFWDLTHEKRGSIAAANTILFLFVAARILTLQFMSFLFNKVNWNKTNLLVYIASIIFPLALWVIGNWALTTLFDGKGRLGQIYMATCYAGTPYVLLQYPLIIISNFVTKDEGAFIATLTVVSLVWSACLVIFAMMQIHEYKISKTLLFTVATGFAMLVMVFIMLLFFSMISQGVSYFVSIGREILFRM